MTTYSQRMAAKAAALAADPERIALMKRSKLEAVRKVAAITRKHAPAGTLVRVVTDDWGNHSIYTIASAPSGPLADHVACDWCGVVPGGSARYLITRDGWTERACMAHAAKFFPELFDGDGRILRYRVVLICDSGIAIEWQDMSAHEVIQFRNDVGRWYQDKPVHRSCSLPDGRSAYSYTWTNDYGTDTVRVVHI